MRIHPPKLRLKADIYPGITTPVKIGDIPRFEKQNGKYSKNKAYFLRVIDSYIELFQA